MMEVASAASRMGQLERQKHLRRAELTMRDMHDRVAHTTQLSLYDVLTQSRARRCSRQDWGLTGKISGG